MITLDCAVGCIAFANIFASNIWVYLHKYIIVLTYRPWIQTFLQSTFFFKINRVKFKIPKAEPAWTLILSFIMNSGQNPVPLNTRPFEHSCTTSLQPYGRRYHYARDPGLISQFHWTRAELESGGKTCYCKLAFHLGCLRLARRLGDEIRNNRYLQ